MAPIVPLAPAQAIRLLRQLERLPAFTFVEQHELARFVAQATRVPADKGQILCGKDDEVQAILVLDEGAYTFDGAARIDVGARGGVVVGFESVVRGGAYDVSITALTDGAYFSIPLSAVKEVYRSSPPFRAAVLAWIVGHAPPSSTDDTGTGAIVKLTSTLPGAPLSLLVRLLCREIATGFPERVILVGHPSKIGPPLPEEIPLGGRGELFEVGADAAWIAANRARYDYLVLDPDAAELAAVTPDVVVELSRAGAPVTQSDVVAPWVLQTMVAPPSPPSCASTLALLDANPSPVHSVESCRVHLDLDDLRRRASAAGGDVPLAALDARTRASLGVWARALTRRRTGVAIAGGGVFSMQGVYVLRQILARGVPVDVITGASAGALVGAYYAALGLAGLDKLVAQGDCGALDAMVLGGVFCGAWMEAFLACSLGAPCIEHLPWAQFYPAISDLSDGAGVVAVAGPLALGLRAASSAPPVFPATITDRRRLVDGGFSNNTPVQALRLFNAGLTFGVNSFPPARHGVHRWVPDCVAQLLATINPINRAFTLLSASSLAISIGGRAQADMACFGYDAESTFPAPYLLMGNFTLSSRMIEKASESEALAKAIDGFVASWERVRDRPGLVGRSSPTAAR